VNPDAQAVQLVETEAHCRQLSTEVAQPGLTQAELTRLKPAWQVVQVLKVEQVLQFAMVDEQLVHWLLPSRKNPETQDVQATEVVNWQALQLLVSAEQDWQLGEVEVPVLTCPVGHCI
jgi:hypothetical protein